MAIQMLCWTASGWPYMPFLCKFLAFSNGCILLTIGSIYTKLGDFVKLGLRSRPAVYDYMDQ